MTDFLCNTRMHQTTTLKLLDGRSTVQAEAPRSASPDNAAEEVFGDADLLECIVAENVGLRTYVAVRQLSRATRDACTDNKLMLRSAALHNGGLNKRDFIGLFSFSYQEGGRFPHSLNGRQHVFGPAAIDQALARPDCMLRMRLHATFSRAQRDAYIRKRYGMVQARRRPRCRDAVL